MRRSGTRATAILLATALGAVVPAAPAAPSPSGAATTVRGADLELLDAVRKIAGRVETLRGRKFDRPPVAVRAPDDMRATIASIRVLDAVDRNRLAARGRAWADLGLGDAQSPERVLRVLAEDVEGAGFDPSGNRLLIAPDRLTIADFDAGAEEGAPSTVLMATGVRVDEPLVAHALMHVGWRERRGSDWLTGTTDRTLGGAAWAEGEANLLAVLYLFSGMGLATDVIESPVDPREVLDGALVPHAVSELPPADRMLVEFVYLDGFRAAAAALRRGGWDAVSAAAARDDGTRAILTPNRPAGEATAVDVPTAAPAAGLERVDVDVLGPEGLFVLVSHTTGKDDIALQAVDAWAGDRLVRWEDGTGRGVTEWITRWRDEAGVRGAEYTLGRVLDARFGPAASGGGDDGTVVRVTSGRVVRFERRGYEIRIRVADRAFDDAGAPPAGGG